PAAVADSVGGANWAPALLRRLVDLRLLQGGAASARPDDERTRRAGADRSGSFEGELENARVATRGHDEVVLEPSAIAVESEVDTRSDTLELDPSVVSDVRVPLPGVVAEQIVAACCERLL